MLHNNTQKVLVVAAHPDDEILGCGATIAKHVANGDQVAVLILGEGITSRYTQRKRVSKRALGALQNKAREAANMLGVQEVVFGGLPDNRFDSVDLLDIVKIVEATKQRVLPRIMYTHFEEDLNIDHRLTYQAVLTATRPQPGETVYTIFSFEIPSSSEWHFGKVFIPDHFIDVEKTFQKKIRALQPYKSEMRPYPHPRSLKGVEILARYRGCAVGKKLVEAFRNVRTIQ